MRADARDAFVVASRHAGVTTVGALPYGARVATSSLVGGKPQPTSY